MVSKKKKEKIFPVCRLLLVSMGPYRQELNINNMASLNKLHCQQRSMKKSFGPHRSTGTNSNCADAYGGNIKPRNGEKARLTRIGKKKKLEILLVVLVPIPVLVQQL